MSRIGADITQMHATVAVLRQGSNNLHDAFQQANQTMQAMQGSRWSGQNRVQAEAYWHQIQIQFGPTIEILDDLALRTERVANALEEAGRVFGEGGNLINEPQMPRLPEIKPLTPDQIRDSLLKGVGELGQIWLKLLSKFGALLSDPNQLGELLRDPMRLKDILSWEEIGQLVRYADQVVDTAGKLLANLDSTADAYLQSLLPQAAPGSKETIRFQLSGDVTIPGMAIGLPTGSPELMVERGAAIARDEDGNYIFTIGDMGGLGLQFDLLPDADVALSSGQNKLKEGLDMDASASVALKAASEVAFKFNPNTPGDMTKMMAFMGAIGLTTAVLPQVPTTVATPLYLMKDNLDHIKVGVTAEGKATMDASALVKLAGVEGKVSGEGGLSMKKNDQGEWEQSTYIAAGLGVEGQILPVTGDVDVKGTIEQVNNLTTGEQRVNVIVDFQGKVGMKDVNDFLPVTPSVSAESYQNLQVKYTLHEPLETVQQSFIDSVKNGGLDIQAIREQSTIEVTTTTGQEVSLGGGLKSSAGGGQSAGVHVEGTITRESEQVIFKK